MKHAFFVTLCILIVATARCDFCSTVAQECSQNTTCGPLYSKFYNDCNQTIIGLESCLSKCNASLTALLQDPIGKRFQTCSCSYETPDFDFACGPLRDNTLYSCYGISPSPSELCTAPTPPPSLPPLCSNVKAECLADAKCNVTFNVYLHLCDSVIKGSADQCWPTCKNRLDDLYCDPIGRNFLYCLCDQTPDCFLEKSNTMRECSGGGYPQYPISSQSCADVTAACKSDSGCVVEQSFFDIYCEHDLLDHDSCSYRSCKNLYANLLKNPIGYHYLGCSCNGDAPCNARRTLESYYCLGRSITTPEPCDDVVDACMQIPSCKKSLGDFRGKCSSGESEATCSPECLDLFEKLLGNPIGARLDHCRCDAADSDCQAAAASIRVCAPTLRPTATAAGTTVSLAFSAALSLIGFHLVQ